MTRLQGLIAKALKSESKNPSLRSEAEQAFLWQVKHAARLPEPTPAFRFHHERKWEFDFAWPLFKLAVEIEGGIYSQGRHVRGHGYEADLEKYNAAALLGWTLLRYSTNMVESGVAYQEVANFIRQISPP